MVVTPTGASSRQTVVDSTTISERFQQAKFVGWMAKKTTQ
jgi:hypothetical protein